MALHIAMATSPPNRTAGILYEIWHTGAAWNMNRIKAAGAEVTQNMMCGGHTRQGSKDGRGHTP